MKYMMLFTISFPNLFSVKCSKLIVQQKYEEKKDLAIVFYQSYIKKGRKNTDKTCPEPYYI